MIIAFRSRFSLDQIFFWSQITVGIAGLVVALVFGLQMMRFKILDVGMKEEGHRSFAMDQMLTGPLSLRENSRSPLALALEQKLVFLAQSIRPDVKREERVFRIGVKGADAQQIVKEGEPIHCNLVEHASGGVEAIEFLEGDGNTAMIPHVLDDRSLLLKVEQACGEMLEVVLKASPEVQSKLAVGENDGALQEAKWWGPDLFFREYGGQEYCLLHQKQQVEVSDKKQRYVLYLGSGDFLSFQEGKWEVIADLTEANRDSPLACVQNFSQDALEIEAWDAEGFSIFHTKLHLEKAPMFHFAPEQVFQGAKQRTAKQVSCKIGKKRFVLQPGDWLLQTKTGWHKLKTANEIDAFLNHDLRGELCVVDGIDTKGKVTGHYFNESRTQMQPFSLQAISSKGTKKGKK